MTKKEIKALKQQILALNWDANRKRAKAENLARTLMTASPETRFTPADYKAFFRSRKRVK